MTERKNIDAEIEAYTQESQAWWEEHDRIKNSPEFKESEAELVSRNKSHPEIGRIIRTGLYIKSSSFHKRDAEAVGVLIDRLEHLLQSEPAIRASRGVTEALRDVIESLETVDFLFAGYSSVVEAFAMPAALGERLPTEAALKAISEKAKGRKIKEWFAELETQGTNIMDRDISGKGAVRFKVSAVHVRNMRTEYLAEKERK